MTATPSLDLISAVALLAVVVVVAIAASRMRWAAAGAIVATAPFAWYHHLGSTELTVQKAAFVGAAIGLAVAWRDPAERRGALRAVVGEKSLIALLAFAVLAACSAAWARSNPDALRDALKWFWYAGAFAIGAASMRDARDSSRVAWCAAVAAICVGVVAFAQHLTGAPSSFVAPGGAVIARLTGTLEGPNQFGAYLDTIVPLLLAVAMNAEMGFWSVAGGALLLGALCAELLLAYSRGSMWSCVAAIVAVAAMRLWARGGVAHVNVRRAALVAALAVAAFAAIAAPAVGEAGWSHEFWTAGLHDASDSAALRRGLWDCAAQLFERHPVAGVGAGNFADAKDECSPVPAPAEHVDADNWYLETAADLGTIGLVVLGCFIVVQLLTAARRRALLDPVALGAYAAFVAFVIHGFVDDVMPYPKAALTLFALLGAIRSDDAVALDP